MIPYGPLKKKFADRTREALAFRAPSGRLVGIYYNQAPNELDDSLNFYLFRKNADFHYPVVYFHPEGQKPEARFLERFDVIPHALPSTWFCSKIAYSHFITSRPFFSILDELAPKAEHYLIFQSDSFLIRSGLERFMDCPFDYFGAVWEKGLIPGALWAPSQPSEVVKDAALHSKLKAVPVGNGGFTLRRINACREVSYRHQISELSYQQEDVFYCMMGQLTGLRLAPLDLARRFSWEDPVAINYYLGELKLGIPVGFHNLMADMADLLVTNSMEMVLPETVKASLSS